MAEISQLQNCFNSGYFQSSCSTKFSKAEFKYTWSINDFSYYCDLKNTEIRSSIFSDGTINGLKWRLIINEHGWCCFDYDKYLTVDVVLVSKMLDDLEAVCTISILNGKLEQLNKVKKYAYFSQPEESSKFFKFIKKSALLDPKAEYLYNDKLTILCEIVVLRSSENNPSEFLMPDDLGLLLFENPDYTEITFSVDGKELRALKVILVASSPVFAAMFNHDTKESESNLIEIKDIDYTVFKEMLRFIYTNKMSNFDGIAKDLLMVADKYELESLKLRCEESMSQSLSVANAPEYCVLADQYNADSLRMLVKTYIKDKAQNIFQHSEVNRSIIEKHPQLFGDLDFAF